MQTVNNSRATGRTFFAVPQQVEILLTHKQQKHFNTIQQELRRVSKTYSKVRVDCHMAETDVAVCDIASKGIAAEASHAICLHLCTENCVLPVT